MNLEFSKSAAIFGSLTVTLFLLASTSVNAAPPVKIILDTDFGDDGDDLAALAALHHLADIGEVELLAVGQSNSRWDAPGAIDVINTYYGRPDIPIGQVGHKTHEGDQYSSFLVENYKYELDLQNVPSAVDVYRRLLVDSPDNSVTFSCVGYKQNLAELLRSQPDEISPLKGVELVKKKVKFMSDMGGGYPTAIDKGCNFKKHSKHAKYFVDHWPTPIIFTGIRWDLELAEELMKRDTSVGRGLKERMRRNEKYPNYPRQPSWDVISALVAAEGWKPHFNVSESGQNVLDEKGNNWFGYEEDRGHRFIDSAKIPKNELRDILDDMLLAPVSAR